MSFAAVGKGGEMVYLLHFDRPISDAHTCQHYLGFCLDLRRRISEHRNHPDARLLQVAKERGIGFTVVRTWPGDRKEERRLKNGKNGPKLCPICSKAHGQLDMFLDFSMTDVSEIAF